MNFFFRSMPVCGYVKVILGQNETMLKYCFFVLKYCFSPFRLLRCTMRERDEIKEITEQNPARSIVRSVRQLQRVNVHLCPKVHAAVCRLAQARSIVSAISHCINTDPTVGQGRGAWRERGGQRESEREKERGEREKERESEGKGERERFSIRTAL